MAGEKPNTASAIRPSAVLIMLFLFQTLNFFDKIVFGLSAVPMMHEYHLAPSSFGLIGSSFFLLYAVSGVFVGLVAIGKVQVKWVLLALVGIWSATEIPIFFIHALPVLIVCRILLGVGEGPGFPSALHACYDWFPPQRRSIPNAIVLQGISVGLLVGSPLLTWVILRSSWRAGFLFCGILGFGWMVLWAFVGGQGPYAAQPHKDVEAAGKPVRVPERILWLDPTVIGVIAMSTMAYWIVGIAPTWLPAYLEEGVGFGKVDTGWIISGIYIVQSVLLLLSSWVAQKIRNSGWSQRSILGKGSGYVLTISALALGLSLYAPNIVRLPLLAIAFASPTVTTILGPLALSAVSPTAQRGRLIVVIYSANTISALFSNAVTGWLVSSGTDLRGGYAHAMGFTALTLAIGSVASFLLIDPERTIERFRRLSPGIDVTHDATRHSAILKSQPGLIDLTEQEEACHVHSPIQ